MAERGKTTLADAIQALISSLRPDNSNPEHVRFELVRVFTFLSKNDVESAGHILARMSLQGRLSVRKLAEAAIAVCDELGDVPPLGTDEAHTFKSDRVFVDEATDTLVVNPDA